MTNQTQNAVSTPAIKKFEVGKTYAAKKSVLFDSQINMTVINRTNCYVTFQFDDDKDDIRRCKVVDDAGVEKICLHETNAIGGDYEFSANDEVTAATVENETAEVKADEVSETVEENTEVTETKMTVSELKEALKASRNKVQLHFTAKGNPAWKCIYHYGKNDREIGTYRLTKREADERLAEFGLTADLVIEIDKAKAEAEAAQCRHLCIDQMGAVLAKFAKAENETVNSDCETAKTGSDEVKDDDSKLAELFQDREVKRRAALHSSFDSEESKAARDANKAVEEFIGKVAKDLRDKAPVGLSVVASWDSADLDAPKFVVIELATDKRTCYSKIAEVKAALKVNSEVTETVNEKFTTVKAENATHAVEILDKLNFRNVEFVYHGDTNEHGAPVVYRHFDGIKDGHDTCFGLIEIVIDGKLDAVRFINNYREQFTDIKIGNAKYTLGDKGEINLIDEPATVKADEFAETVDNVTFTDETEIARFEVGKRYRGKLDCGTKKIDCTIEVIKRTAKCIVYPTGGNTNPFCTKIKCSDTSEYISPASGLFVKASDVVIEPQLPTVDEPKIDSDASIVEVADTLNELDAAEYAITEEAFNVALDAEIELAAKTDEPETVTAETAEVKADEVNDEGLSTFDIGDDTVKFINGEFYQVFSHKYRAAIVKAGCLHYCIFNDGDTEVYDVGGHEVSYDEFIATLEERAKADEVTDTVNETVNSEVDEDKAEEKVEKLFDAYEAQNSVAHISENGYIAAVNFQPQNTVHWHCKIRRYQNLDEAIDAVRYVNEHDTFTVTRGGRVEIEYGKRSERTREYFARNLYGVEYFKEAYFDELVDQYAVTVDAFNFAVEYEIEEAEIAAAESRAIARILANDNLAARYEKAKTQVKCERYENGYCGWSSKASAPTIGNTTKPKPPHV